MDEDLRALLDSATVKGTDADGRDVLLLSVEKGTAPTVWRRLRDAHTVTGLWPFLADRHREVPYDQPMVWDHLTDGGHCAGTRSAEEIFAGDTADVYDESEDEYPEDTDKHLALMAFGGEPDLSGSPEVREPVEAGTTNLGLVRTEAGGWDIPRLLGWDGALNYDVSGIEHSNVLKYWHERYGAELMVATFDVLELSVANPPTERAEVEAVARAQYNYCGDIVDQGFESMAALAEHQVHSRHWYFWWD